MANPSDRFRKQRTRGHIIADLSYNHVERFVLEEGHAVGRAWPDYGYDLVVQTHDERGEAEPGFILFQLKASDHLIGSADFFSFDVDVRDYNLWTNEPSPVVLVLYDAAAGRAFWVHVQEYFGRPGAPRPKARAKTVRIRVGRGARFNRRAVRAIRAMKTAGLIRIAEGT